MFDTPVAFLIFNRPDCTQRVFEAIARLKPRKLLVIADGPRPDRPGEAEQVAAARNIIEQVDWPCQVLKNYADINMGCRRRPSSGMDWVFDTVEEAIILEDDCLPDPTFFTYCRELLGRYRHDERVMSICGSNFHFGRSRTPYSYYFSKFTQLWGWASWRRAWQYYDVNMRKWPEFRDSGALRHIADSKTEEHFWKMMFDRYYYDQFNSWCFQWTFASLSQNALNIIPNVNLITNIGYDDRATHTTAMSPLANLPAFPLDPLAHPPTIWRHKEADAYTFQQVYYSGVQAARVQRIKRILQRLGTSPLKTMSQLVQRLRGQSGSAPELPGRKAA